MSLIHNAANLNYSFPNCELLPVMLLLIRGNLGAQSLWLSCHCFT